MPSTGSHIPGSVRMEYDVLQWYADHIGGHGSALAVYGDAILQVDDPFRLCERRLAESMLDTPSYAWELESALAQARRDNSKTWTRPETLEPSGLVRIG